MSSVATPASAVAERLSGFNGVAALRAAAPVNGVTYWLRYHTTEGDGGGGRFRCITGAAPGTYTDDTGGYSVLPVGGDGSVAWVREEVSPMRTSYTGGSFANAIAAAQAAGRKFVVVDGPVSESSATIPAGFWIDCDGEGAALTLTNTVSASLTLAGTRITFGPGMVILGASSSVLGMTTSAQAQYCRFLPGSRVQTFGKFLDVQHAMYWSEFHCELRDCDVGIESLISQNMNACRFTGTMFHTAAGATTFPVHIYDSDGLVFAGVNVQNIGPKLDSCSNVRISGGYWEAYTYPALTLVNTEAVADFYPPSATVFDIDDASYQLSRGALPATSIYPYLAPVSHDGKNVFPGHECDTSAAFAIAEHQISGAAFTTTINASTNLQLDATAAGFMGFRVRGPVRGIAALMRIRVITGTWKVQFYSPTGGVDQVNINQFSDTSWHVVRMHSKVTDDAELFLGVSTVGTVTGTFSVEIDYCYVVPDMVCIGRRPLSSLSERVIGGQFLTHDAGITNIAGSGGSATVYTFSASEPGLYEVSSLGALRTSSGQRVVSKVMVHSDSTLTISTDAGLTNIAAHTSSGLALIVTNNGGSAADFHTEIRRLSS